MDREDILIDAANGTAGMVGTENCQKLMMYQLKLCGAEIVRHLSPDDAASLFVPVTFERGGRDVSGCILVLADRAVFAWSTGTLRIRNEEAVVPLSTITDVTVGTRPGTRLSVALKTVRVLAHERWTIVLPHVFGGFPVEVFLQGLLSGFMVAVTAEESQQRAASAARARDRASLLLLA